MKRSLFILIFFLISIGGFSQDIVFSQLNNSRLDITPGFAGSFKVKDIVLNHRNFSPTGWGNYLTYRASFSQHFDAINGGVALQFMRDDQGQGAISRSYISGMYAYQLRLRPNMTIHPALEAKYAVYSLNTSELVFPDMFNTTSWQIDEEPETIPRRSDHYLEFNAGFILTYENEYLRSYRDWTLGLAVRHLNKPTSLLHNQQKLNRQWSLYFDIELFLKQLNTYQSSTLLIPTFLYSGEKGHHRFHYGTYLKYKNLRMGAFIRHNAAMDYLVPVFQLGAVFPEINLDYSYDAGFLNYKRTSFFSGAHEVTLSINLSIKESNKQ